MEITGQMGLQDIRVALGRMRHCEVPFPDSWHKVGGH